MMGTIGVSLLGGIAGVLVDRAGPRIPTLLGSGLLLTGYFLIYHCYVSYIRSILLLAIGTCMAGFGSTLTYSSSMKTSAVNFPHSRGTATAFPIAAFGLSAFVFSTISTLFFKGDTAGFLMVLAITTSSLCFFGAPFLKMPFHSGHSSLPATHSTDSLVPSSPVTVSTTQNNPDNSFNTFNYGSSSNSHASLTTLTHNQQPVHHNPLLDDSHAISGYEMITRKEFWAQFLVLGLLAGSGQMYIYSVGYIVRAISQYGQTDPVSDNSIQGIQSFQVALISLSSFLGRIISGIMSDVLNHKLEVQRLWMIFGSCIVAISVHTIMATVMFTNSAYLWPLSCLVGLSYGLAFGVFPTIVADTFGMYRYSQNWGMVCVSPVFGVYLFNLIFGRIYDSNSITIKDPNNEKHFSHVCFKGSKCYSGAFVYTSTISVFTLALICWMIWTLKHQHPAMISRSFNKYLPVAFSGDTSGSSNENANILTEEENAIIEEDQDEVEVIARSAIIP